MKALGERKHDGWCATQTHTTGKCNCHLAEIAQLETDLADARKEIEGLRESIVDAIGKINNENDPDAPVVWFIENVRDGLYKALRSKDSGETP